MCLANQKAFVICTRVTSLHSCYTFCTRVTEELHSFLSQSELSNFFVYIISKGIIKIGDLVTEKNQFISQCNQSRVNLSPKDIFDLMSLVDAIPAPWRQSLKINGYLNKSPFVIQDQIQLVLNNQEVSITEATFKSHFPRKSKIGRHS